MKKISAVLFFFSITFAFCAVPQLKKIGTFPCGRQPKQVLFSPDDKYIVMPLLEDDGIDLFNVETKKMETRLKPPTSDKLGFVEGLFIPSKKSFFVSQMTTNEIHEYTYPGFVYKRSILTGGVWTKFMVWSEDKKIIAASNWVSNDISIISYSNGKLLRLIKTAAAPRGLYFVNRGKYIISLAFDGSTIEKFETDTGKRVAYIEIPKSAMRHVVLNSEQTKAYISDMYWAKIYQIDLASFKIEKEAKVYVNPNTIDLYKNRYLFVSCRGYNNPKDYTKRSPSNGQIYIIDTTDFSVVKKAEGGNQPTGLDISNSQKYLCFSNFQDYNIELYEIED